jgi:integrase/recombinase XerD
MKTKSITISQAVAGFLLNLEGRRLSPNTIHDYKNTFTRFIAQTENPALSAITPETVSTFLASFPSLSRKTLSNYHVALSSLFSWLEKQELVDKNIIHQVTRPKPERRVIDPLEEHEIKSLLAALGKSAPYARPGKRTSDHSLPNAERNRAIILFFLDNGARVSELTGLKISDLDIKNQRAFVIGKGSRERYLPYSARTGQAIWRYLTTRPETEPDDPLFATREGRPMNRRLVQQTLEDIGTRAGVPNVHPHRFRHTFAITYLRAGGDIFTLQMILGHAELQMVRRYSALAQTDVKRAHRRASPVEYLNL